MTSAIPSECRTQRISCRFMPVRSSTAEKGKPDIIGSFSNGISQRFAFLHKRVPCHFSRNPKMGGGGKFGWKNFPVRQMPHHGPEVYKKNLNIKYRKI